MQIRSSLNKKGHHELGTVPYLIVGTAIGFCIAMGKKVIQKIKKIIH